MRREVGETNYVMISARYAHRGMYNNSHFYEDLGRMDREGDGRELIREQQRAAASAYFRDPKNAKDLNPLIWVPPGDIGYHKDYRNDGNDYNDFEDGSAGAGVPAM